MSKKKKKTTSETTTSKCNIYKIYLSNHLPNSPESTISFKSKCIIIIRISIYMVSSKHGMAWYYIHGCIEYSTLTQIVYTVIMKIITKIYPLKTNFVVVSSFYLRSAQPNYCMKKKPKIIHLLRRRNALFRNAFQTIRLYTPLFGFSYVFHFPICILMRYKSCLCSVYSMVNSNGNNQISE